MTRHSIFLRSNPGLLRSTTALFKTRLFGSASAAAIQYDDENDYDEYTYDDPMVDSEGSRPRRGVRWAVIGEPGSKKHVYAERLSKVLDVPHISMATLVLQELHPRSSVYRKIEDAVSLGKLVPEDVIFGLLSKRLEEGHSRGETGFILDGIPRTRMQAEVLDQIVDIDLVLNFKCNGKVERKQVSGLNLQPEGSQIKSLTEEAVLKEKLWTYGEQCKLLEDFYREQKKLLNFEVAEGHGKSWQDLLSVLQLRHLKSNFQKLTV